MKTDYTPAQVDQLDLNQKRWLWVAPLVLSIMAACAWLSVYWGVSLIRKIPSLVPVCCVILFVSIYSGFFLIRYWNEYPSPNHAKVFKRYLVVFVILSGAAGAYALIV